VNPHLNHSRHLEDSTIPTHGDTLHLLGIGRATSERENGQKSRSINDRDVIRSLCGIWWRVRTLSKLRDADD
jgi:hypothetical protein